MSRTFQISNVLADLAVIENMILALLGTDRRKWVCTARWTRSARCGRAPWKASRESASNVARTIRRGSSPTASAASSSSRSRSTRIRASSSSTSRAPALARASASGSRRRSRALPREITLLMIEHDMDVALGLADRVTVLHRGKVILEGTPAEVQANPEVREVYFGHV